MSDVDVDCSTTVGSVQLASPILTASGTAGHGAELSAFFDLRLIGAVTVKSLAPYPWPGNAPVRVHQTPQGMINSVGLQGPGIEKWMQHELPQLMDAGATVVASIWGRSIQDYQAAADALADAPPDVVAVELNISCPNTESRNELFAHSASATAAVVAATSGCNRPRWAKLSPNAGPAVVAVAEAAVTAGVEALTVANTYFGLCIDTETRRPVLGNGGGGVSGAAIHPLAVRLVADIHAALPSVPIVAAGGARSVTDVIEFALAGASAIQVGTATFADPRVCERLASDLPTWCAKHGVHTFTDLIGAAQLT